MKLKTFMYLKAILLLKKQKEVQGWIKNIFTETEWTNISENDISLTYIDRYIHDDDTVIRIKEKF